MHLDSLETLHLSVSLFCSSMPGTLASCFKLPLESRDFLFQRDRLQFPIALYLQPHKSLPSAHTQTGPPFTPHPQVDTTTSPDLTSLPARSDVPSSCTSWSDFLGAPKIRNKMCRLLISGPTRQFLGWRCSENQCFDYV